MGVPAEVDLNEQFTSRSRGAPEALATEQELWKLDLANETVWNGDDGTTAVNDPTDRYGVELETRFELTSWLAADLDLTFTHSQFTTDHENGRPQLWNARGTRRRWRLPPDKIDPPKVFGRRLDACPADEFFAPGRTSIRRPTGTRDTTTGPGRHSPV